MADDKEISVKVSIDPFQELDKKKWEKIEVDVKGLYTSRIWQAFVPIDKAKKRAG